MNLLKTLRLRKDYGRGAGIFDVSLTVAAGSVTGFIGVNGAGKSTTLRCIMGLIRPDAGEVTLFGGPASRVGLRRIGFLPEERGLFPRERARDVVAFHARLKGVARNEAFRSADRLLERIGLEGRTRARIEDLSKGNAQRVQILCALAHRPDLLILDEPMSGLDPLAQSEVADLFSEFKAGGGGLLYSTHDLASAAKLCDQVVMLNKGRVVFDGPVEDAGSSAPHGAMIVTTDAEGLTSAAHSVGGEVSFISSGVHGGTRWSVSLPKTTPHPALLRALSEHAVPIFAFEPIEATLEAAFWRLSTGEAPVRVEERAA